MSFTYKYPRPALTVDAVVFRQSEKSIEVLLIQRGLEPFSGEWALPGGFVNMNETLEEAIHRELEEETALKNIALKQLHAFSTLERDPRGRTISMVFWGLLEDQQQAVSGDDASDTKWFNINELPPLAFDHDEVVKMAIANISSSKNI